MGCGKTETQKGSSGCEAGGAKGKAVLVPEMGTSMNIDAVVTHLNKVPCSQLVFKSDIQG